MNCDLLLTVSLTHLRKLDGGVAVEYFSSVIRIRAACYVPNAVKSSGGIVRPSLSSLNGWVN